MRTCLRKIEMLAATLATAASVLLALLFTACPNNAGGNTGGGTPASVSYRITFRVDGGHGTLKATAEGIAETDKSPITVEKDKTVTFTATATAAEHYADEWTIKGGSFKAGGKDGDTTATVQITGETEVKVNFSRYKSVAFGTDGADLAAYLNSGTPAADGIYYIKVTGLTAADLKGDYTNSPPAPSALGKILNDNPTKKVALKLSEVSGLTDISACFYNCKSLTQAPVIPSSVTNMQDCFYNCKSLTQAPVIPSSVTNMQGCFFNCQSLTQAPVIPSSVTNMQACFYDCTSLTQAPVIPSGVTNMRYCFSNCTRLTQAPVIPSGVTDMQDCFRNCTSLTQAPVIPSGVTYMSSCFSGCESLTQAPVIPSNVTNMDVCFYGCEKITAVTLKCNYVDGRFNYAFSDCSSLSAGSIKVPSGQLQTYQDNAGTMGAQKEWFVAE